MKFSERLLRYGPLMMFLMIIVQLLTGWTFVRFVHFHTQNAVLPANSYECEVFTAEDYRKLKDPQIDSVELSDGSKLIDRQPAWFKLMLPQIKQINDDTYVLVRTLGTAHFAQRWLRDVIPILGLAIAGLALAIWNLRRTAVQ